MIALGIANERGGSRGGHGAHRPQHVDALGTQMRIESGQVVRFQIEGAPTQPVMIVEGFRAPAGVLNPDVYDPRSPKRWSMGIADLAGDWERYDDRWVRLLVAG